MDLFKSITGILRRGLLTGLLFVGFTALTAAVIARPIENLVRDLMLSTISPFVAPPDTIVLVKITEDTLKAFPYRSPVDRGFLAALVEKLAAAKPAAIGIDILFDQPTEPEKDNALQAALQNAVSGAGVRVVIAGAEAQDGLNEKQIAWLGQFAPGVARGLAALSRDAFDGVVRETFPGRSGDGAFRPGLASAVAGVTFARRDPEPLVYYRTAGASPHAFKSYPAHTAKLLPPAWFAGKYVLIGVDLPLDDRHGTSFIVPNGVSAGTLPGMEIHAHALAQILSGDRIVRPSPALSAFGMILVGAAAAWLGWRPMPILLKPVVAIALLVAFWGAAALAFWRGGIAVPIALPSILIAGVSAFAAFIAWKRDSDERRFIEGAFSKYVSPAVVRQIVANPGQLKLGGERRNVTCVFTDIEGFTTFSESVPPERAAAILNAYLDRMCNLFVAHGATLDKLIGDAVVGFFGAPAEQADQAGRAVALALGIDDLSEAFRAEMAAAGLKVGITRVGVHGGPAIVGNFGGERFFDYTAIGDTVNTAARLEGANKYIGTRICVSGQVAKAAASHAFRPSGIVFLKGKTQGVETFEPLKPGSPSLAYLDEYLGAFALMARKDKKAAVAFGRLAKTHPQDKLAAFHGKRLAEGQKGAEIVLSDK